MKKFLILSLFLTCTLSVLKAQETPASTLDSREITADTQMASVETQNDYTIDDRPSKNFVKFNLTSLALKNFSLQYERVLSKRVSAAVSFSLMPKKSMPTFIADQFVRVGEIFADGIDAETVDIIRNISFSSYTITPEVRFYPGKKGYGTGFYMALFYRYGHFEASNLPIPYTNDLEEEITINTSGTITSHTGGLLLGYQWALGKHMCLDWQMFGPHFGVSSGDFLGLPSSPLSAQDQTDIENEFLKIDSKLIKQTVDATADEVKMLYNGPWGGIRFALAIGVKF